MSRWGTQLRNVLIPVMPPLDLPHLTPPGCCMQAIEFYLENPPSPDLRPAGLGLGGAGAGAAGPAGGRMLDPEYVPDDDEDFRGFQPQPRAAPAGDEDDDMRRALAASLAETSELPWCRGMIHAQAFAGPTNRVWDLGSRQT